MSVKSAARSLARRSDAIQTLYERRKNKARETLLRGVIPQGGVGAELGVHKGHLTPLLIEWLRPDFLYVVDPWHLLGPEWDWAAGDKSTVNALSTVIRRIRPALESRAAEIVVDDDLAFLARLEDGALDWVYLDSSHAYEHTLQELELLVLKVKHSGVIAGDDWNADPADRHHGVCKAVREFEADGRVEIIMIDEATKQWAAKPL